MLRMHGMVQWYEVDHDLRVSLVADDDAVVAAVAARRLFYVLCFMSRAIRYRFLALLLGH